MLIVTGIPVTFDGWEKRRLMVCDRARGWFAIHEHGIATTTNSPQITIPAPQANGDDLTVAVAMLDRGILGHVNRPHRCAR